MILKPVPQCGAGFSLWCIPDAPQRPDRRSAYDMSGQRYCPVGMVDQADTARSKPTPPSAKRNPPLTGKRAARHGTAWVVGRHPG